MTTVGPYITKRLLPSFIERACDSKSIDFTRFSDDWILKLEKDTQRRWVCGYSFDVNSTGASNVARDKVATYQALVSDNIPGIKHFLAVSRALEGVQVDKLSDLPDDAPVVIKPLEGAAGHGVQLVSSKTAAISYLQSYTHADWAMCPFYDISSELRLMLLDDKCLCAYDKTNPADNNGLKMFNLSLGAKANVLTPSLSTLELAQKARQSVGLRLAAVDIATLSDGSVIVVEVNEGIMMENFARQSSEYREIAQDVYKEIVGGMFE